MIPIVTPAEMGAIDAAAPEPVETLIGRAGWHVSVTALGMLGGGYGRVVNLIAGPGNNGADGRVGCEFLSRRGVAVRTFETTDLPRSLPPADLTIDAAFGTGFRGSWDAPATAGEPILAVDIPSGVHGLTGTVEGPVLAADRTVTFQALKPGLVLGAGPEVAGVVDVVDIGLDASGVDAHLVTADDVWAWWPDRAVDAHKWRRAVRVIAGSPDMPGAAALATAAAARAGAGLVQLVTAGDDRLVGPEIVRRRVPAGELASFAASPDRFGALVVGPGLGRSAETVDAARSAVRGGVPVIVDGDGLMAFEETPPRVESPCLLTPHDGEFARITGSAPGDDRLAATREAARTLGCTVLLKGPTTVVADPGGSVLVVDHGDQRLATAGSGDVLSGIIGFLLAAGLAPISAGAVAAWIHAEAARQSVAAGLVAPDIVEGLPAVLPR